MTDDIQFLRCEWCFTFLTFSEAKIRISRENFNVVKSQNVLECKGCKRKFKIKTK